MGFIPASNKAVVLIPKCGATTLSHVSNCLAKQVRGNTEPISTHAKGERGWCEFDDHKPLSEIRAGILEKYPELYPTTEFGVNIRHPVDRLVSAINHKFKGAPDSWDLLKVLEMNKQPDNLFTTTQASWIENDAVLFKFDTMEICRWLGWTGDIPKLNARPQRWTRKQVELLPTFNDEMEKYADDWLLWEKVV